MFSGIISFIETAGESAIWPVIVLGLLGIKCIVPNNLEKKVKEVKKEDGTKEYHIYDIK